MRGVAFSSAGGLRLSPLSSANAMTELQRLMVSYDCQGVSGDLTTTTSPKDGNIPTTLALSSVVEMTRSLDQAKSKVWW